MPPALAILLIATPVLLLGARAVLPGLPWKRYARTSTWLDIVLLTLGALGLVMHCVAMFYRDLIDAIPGTGGYARAVNEMGWVSITLYVLPAALVLAGLRRQHPLALAIVVITLVAVGVTMYDGGPLTIHLATIAAAALALALTTALLVRLPRRREKVALPK